MYKKPTDDGIKWAIDQGWTKEQAERGYEIFDYDGIGICQIEAICDCYPESDYDDSEWAKEAERSGFCKIIPVNELPEDFEIDGHSARWFGWIDTPENREAIKKYCEVGRRWQ